MELVSREHPGEAKEWGREGHHGGARLPELHIDERKINGRAAVPVDKKTTKIPQERSLWFA
jgi:hypothetical protein